MIGDREDGASERQLALDVDETRLPWLESVEDEPEEDSRALRLALGTLIGVLVVAALGGGVYWVQQQLGGGPEGDGSLIAAPAGPYKVKPADPQMAKVEGTGDASYIASQGGEPEARLAVKEAEPKPSDSVLVQLGAYSTEGSARTGWTTLTQAHDFLKGMDRRIVAATVDGGTVYRLSAVTGSREAAEDVCDRLKKAGENCLVIR